MSGEDRDPGVPGLVLGAGNQSEPVLVSHPHLRVWIMHAGYPMGENLRALMFAQELHRAGDDVSIVFDGGGSATAAALAEPGTDVRLFGKPESFVKRRMGVALAQDLTTDEARAKALRVSRAVKVRPA